MGALDGPCAGGNLGGPARKARGQKGDSGCERGRAVKEAPDERLGCEAPGEPRSLGCGARNQGARAWKTKIPKPVTWGFAKLFDGAGERT